MANYLTLVNNAIEEAGVDLDALTSSNFASPPNQKMYERFKKWVNDAWKEFQVERDNWEFSVGRATVFLYPAVYVEEGTRATAPPAASTYTTEDTDVTIEVASVELHDGTWAGGDAKATIYFLEDESPYKLNEMVDEITPTPAADKFRIKGKGTYNFLADGQVPDLEEIHKRTLFLQTTGGSTDQTNDAGTGLTPIQFVPYNNWLPNTAAADARGAPVIFTETPDGRLEFYPRPDKIYNVTFSYSKSINSMSAYSDTPTDLPSKYHDMLYWAAVMKYGLYDRQQAVYANGKKHFDMYKGIANRNLLPDVGWAASQYNRED